MTRPTTSPAPDRRAPLLIAGVVILAVIATIAAFVIFGDEPETAAPSTPASPESAPASEVPPSEGAPSPSTPPSASPAPTPVAAPEEWTLVHEFGAEGMRWVGGEIAYGDAGFLAIGRRWEGTEGGPRIVENAMWLSADGRDWTEVAYPLAETGNYDVMALTGAADGSYVMHALGPPQDGVPSVSVALRSTDGSTWEPIETGLPDTIAVQAVERGPLGYLLVGGQTSGGNPTLWISPDGLTWELVHEFTQDDAFVQLDDGDAGEEGYVVIGRRIEPEGGDYQRFSFASADGREWVERPEPFGAEDQAFVEDVAVSSLGADWVATHSERDGTTSTWLSADGLSWTEAGSIPVRNENVAHAGLLAEVSGELISSPGGGIYFDGTPGVFSSTDGATWSSEDLGGDAWLHALAVGDGVVAITGTIPGEEFSTAGAIWIRSTD